MVFYLLINVKMPTIVGILTFRNREKSILGLSEPKKGRISLYFYTYEHLKFHAHEKSFITSGPDFECEQIVEAHTLYIRSLYPKQPHSRKAWLF